MLSTSAKKMEITRRKNTTGNKRDIHRVGIEGEHRKIGNEL